LLCTNSLRNAEYAASVRAYYQKERQGNRNSNKDHGAGSTGKKSKLPFPSAVQQMASRRLNCSKLLETALCYEHATNLSVVTTPNDHTRKTSDNTDKVRPRLDVEQPGDMAPGHCSYKSVLKHYRRVHIFHIGLLFAVLHRRLTFVFLSLMTRTQHFL
jgi:hypothetical protein